VEACCWINWVFYSVAVCHLPLEQSKDAGLIFLSSMSNTIENRILNEGGATDDVLSTTSVLLSLGTAMLGLVLVAMGHFFIFSQTIFTYRTGVHSKWIGFLIMLVFWYVVTSPTLLFW
jgi:hypothetical protein